MASKTYLIIEKKTELLSQATFYHHTVRDRQVLRSMNSRDSVQYKCHQFMAIGLVVVLLRKQNVSLLVNCERNF